MEQSEKAEVTGRGYERRKRIFEIYSNQLTLLVSNGLVSGINLPFDKTYLCPICLRPFSASDLSDDAPNMLTLDDAPPKSLGGRASVLTCKSCNSTCGHEIDFHLTERLIELDARSFLPNTETKVKVTNKGSTVQGKVEVDSTGGIKVTHHEKINHPIKLESYISGTGKGSSVYVEFPKSRVDAHRLEVALLKSAYILAFAKFGYSFILDPVYDIVREQLKNPDKDVYPEGFWTKQDFAKEHEGVHLITESGLAGFFSIFSLNTGSKTTRFGCYLPIPNKNPHEVVKTLKTMTGGFSLSLDATPGDFLADLNRIKELRDWIDKLR